MVTTTSDAPAPDELAPLPRRVVLGLSVGHGGMSILINLIGLLLVFFYLPPNNSDLPQLVTDAAFLVVLNAIVLVAASGRLLDAITDPVIAIMSDRSTHRLGRRIPFMLYAAFPAALLTFLMFLPPFTELSGWNLIWLAGVQILLYVPLTAYVTPAFSLVADLGRTSDERLDLATWTSVFWALGIVIAGLATPLGALFESFGMSELRGLQSAVGVVCLVALGMMLVPVKLIDEPRYARSEPTAVPMREMIATVMGNRFFRYYLAADFAYFCGLMIIQTGALYYVTVLLDLEEGWVALLLALMVLLALMLYPVVNAQAKKRSPKSLVVLAFALAAIDFGFIVFLGRYPIPNLAQAALAISGFALPFSILSVLPSAILSDIAEYSARTTGQATAGLFFAARTFLQKIAQTVGVMGFALLTSFGRDVGDDLGIRLSGAAGLALYGLAALLFLGYRERELREELAA